MDTTALLFGAIPGGPEMLIILFVLILLFGANKIPKLARSTGQAMGEFKKGREEIEDELEDMQEETVGDLNDRDETGTAGAGTATDTATETETERN
ncbi:twin-arginine translocase TatA/TatE family subunit [Candidatus Halobonum tyrrellensis]|uniref:Twin-arginine translocation protein, TatA/E family subunit n=1 Tax=Candidatus Halobonum tyrrellensis G22 TaxID=1324957 RepID=V4J2J8_9EURY|nr:twin-arginine translocase TatA/TatE family subunit [Candidatus Halobonum tyrrellensis]ESP89632.1 twin-arginine translocation protein, TatA/E family subunit [Candidatus Halobonum tyrrellensis G22]